MNNKIDTNVPFVDIKFSDLKYTVKLSKNKEKEVLKSISGNFKAGELTAIMGPSGAGKSTLMNILTGFVQTGVEGSITFGNAPKSRKLCCYILQEDHFFPWFTVEEAMLLAATLKISNKSLNLKEKQMLIEQILDSLKLGKCKQTKCSNLSGGQKKRLSIALELIDNPSILFLDEPTTGLDSATSFDTIKLLEDLANDGRTIVCTIHQPSSTVYHIFKHIYVLKAGRCVYQGSPSNTVNFLKLIGPVCPSYHNPADFLLEAVSGEYGDFSTEMVEAASIDKWRHDASSNDKVASVCNNELRKINEASQQKDKSTLEIESKTKHIYPPAEWLRLWILIGRCHMQFFRDWTVTYLKLGLHFLCGILVGLLFGDSGSNATKAVSNVSLFIFSIVYLWYTTMMPGVLRFPLEIDIIKKETFNNWYKLRTYYIATLITSTPVHIIFSTVFSTITYFMTDQPFELDRFMKFLLITIIMTIVADGMGILLGTILSPVNGTFCGAILTSYMLTYSGFLIFFDHMSTVMRWISYTSSHRYALESLVLSVYDNNRSEMICPPDVIYCHFKNANLVLKTLGMADGSYSFNVIMLLLQIALFKGLAYFTLKRKLGSI